MKLLRLFVVTLPAFASLGGQPTCVRACGCHFISPPPRQAAEARRARHLRPMVGRGKDALIPPNLSWQAHAWLRCTHPAGLGAKAVRLGVSKYPPTHTLTLAVHALSPPSVPRRTRRASTCLQRRSTSVLAVRHRGCMAHQTSSTLSPPSFLASVSARTQALALGAPAERHGLLVASTEIRPVQDPVHLGRFGRSCAAYAAGEIPPTQCIVEWALRRRVRFGSCFLDPRPTPAPHLPRTHTASALARRPFA